MYYVRMTDKFMSGWGPATGKINKLVIECETYDQALQISCAAKRRSEMRRVNIRVSRPRYGAHVLTSWKTYADMGGPWVGEPGA